MKPYKNGAINIIPLVDVVLVLLVIFMITAPASLHHESVNLPTSSGEAVLGQTEHAASLVLRQDLTLIFRDKPVTYATLPVCENATLYVDIQADESVAYKHIIHLLSQLKQKGYQRLRFVALAT